MSSQARPRTGRRAVLKVSGDLDLATQAGFRARIAAALAGQGTRLVLDLSGVTFMDARGLAALVAARDMATARHGSLRLTGVTPAVLRLLEVTRLDRTFSPVSLADVRPAA
ncbi:STAS domain-containing protein [Actinomadura sp. ATCC 39365]|uniref:STAS domain-containing protein n=1 Tax=Nonomuraea sp. NPDC005692 TaxID=3157168 RepID=UPI0033F1A325